MMTIVVARFALPTLLSYEMRAVMITIIVASSVAIKMMKGHDDDKGDDDDHEVDVMDDGRSNYHSSILCIANAAS